MKVSTIMDRSPRIEVRSRPAGPCAGSEVPGPCAGPESSGAGNPGARCPRREAPLAPLRKGHVLSAWARDPGISRLLITCRHPFTLREHAERGLSFWQLGPLSRAETMKLAWSLPSLDRLDARQLEQVWRLAGGHP